VYLTEPNRPAVWPLYRVLVPTAETLWPHSIYSGSRRVSTIVWCPKSDDFHPQGGREVLLSALDYDVRRGLL